MLDIKPTQEHPYKYAATKLEQAVKNVSKKPVFCVERKENYFVIKNYYSNRTVIKYVPTRRIAEKICSRYNKNKPFSFTEKRTLQRLIERYMKLMSEQFHYESIIRDSKEKDSRDTVRSRYTLVKDRQHALEEYILDVI